MYAFLLAKKVIFSFWLVIFFVGIEWIAGVSKNDIYVLHCSTISKEIVGIFSLTLAECN